VIAGFIRTRLKGRYLRSLVVLLVTFACCVAMLAHDRSASVGTTRELSQLQTTLMRHHDLLQSLNEVVGSLGRAQSGQRGYLLTRNPTFLDDYLAGRKDAEESLVRLRELASVDPAQRRQADELERTAERFLAYLAETLTGDEAAFARVSAAEGLRRMGEIRALEERLRVRERALFEMRKVESRMAIEEIQRRQAIGLYLGLALMLLCSSTTYWFVRAHKRIEGQLLRENRKVKGENTRLSELSTTDPLTGMLNRRGFAEHLEAVLAAGQGPVSLLVVDIDRFKEINDTFGHAFGDAAIAKTGQILRTTLRGETAIARFGGEEFVVLLPGADASGAHAAAERLRAAVEGHAWERAPITVSVGAATEDAAEADAENLFKEADNALYRAKRSGRNLVLHAADLAEAAATSG
jgi:diguanylate cyclase (GGDEF)-like protein